MDAVLAGVFAVPFHLSVQISKREGLTQLDPAIALEFA